MFGEEGLAPCNYEADEHHVSIYTTGLVLYTTLLVYEYLTYEASRM